MSGSENSPGIIPYALHDVFETLTKNITDLLNPEGSILKIRENAEKEISVQNITEKVVTSVDDVIVLMRSGERNRHVGCTNMNEKSSRSHTILRMVSGNF